MVQPPGFIDPTHPTHVCCLCKAIYDLKQAPRARYTDLRNYLTSVGFKNSSSETSLFYTQSSKPLYVLVYVDDIIIIGSCPHSVLAFIYNLGHRFSLKDLGNLSNFLGVDVQPITHGLFLSQRKYIVDLLCRANMNNAKHVSTPMDLNPTLSLHSGTTLDDPTKYCTLVGSLQYCGLTRPDIAFSVNKLSQFMHRPTTTHWPALKRLLCYLNDTLSYGLNIYCNSPMTLHAYSDSD